MPWHLTTDLGVGSSSLSGRATSRVGCQRVSAGRFSAGWHRFQAVPRYPHGRLQNAPPPLRLRRDRSRTDRTTGKQTCLAKRGRVGCRPVGRRPLPPISPAPEASRIAEHAPALLTGTGLKPWTSRMPEVGSETVTVRPVRQSRNQTSERSWAPTASAPMAVVPSTLLGSNADVHPSSGCCSVVSEMYPLPNAGQLFDYGEVLLLLPDEVPVRLGQWISSRSTWLTPMVSRLRSTLGKNLDLSSMVSATFVVTNNALRGNPGSGASPRRPASRCRRSGRCRDGGSRSRWL